jgi:hypothetical protein
MVINHFALVLMHTTGKLAADLLQTHSLGTRSFWHLFRALTSDPQNLIVGSELSIQEHAVVGQRNAAIHNLHLHVMIYKNRLFALPSGQYPSSLSKTYGAETLF